MTTYNSTLLSHAQNVLDACQGMPDYLIAAARHAVKTARRLYGISPAFFEVKSMPPEERGECQDCPYKFGIVYNPDQFGYFGFFAVDNAAHLVRQILYMACSCAGRRRREREERRARREPEQLLLALSGEEVGA